MKLIGKEEAHVRGTTVTYCKSRVRLRKDDERLKHTITTRR